MKIPSVVLGSLLGVLISFSAFASDNIESVAERLIEDAIEKKILFVCEETVPLKYANFYEFRFPLPRRIEENNIQYQKFINYLKQLIHEQCLRGPNGRPIVIIPECRIREKKKVEAQKTLGPNYAPPRYPDYGPFGY